MQIYKLIYSTYISLYAIEYECVNIDHIDYESINALAERACRHLKIIVIFEKNSRAIEFC